MSCKYLKIRKHDNKKEKRIYYYCTLLKQEVPYCRCQQCDSKEYKKLSEYQRKESKIKQRTYRQVKKEKNRYSILTDDLNICIVCGKNKEHLHEIFGGRNRSSSIKYGLVLPLCSNCHRRIHNNPELIEEWHKKGQMKFIQIYPNLNFIDVFFRDYL